MLNSLRTRLYFWAITLLVGVLLVLSGLWQVAILFSCLIAGYLLVWWGNRMNRPQT